jgi:CheY-like chemotaxis protein
MMTQTATGLRPARKVLVIDDEEALCVLLRRVISKLGYNVTTSNQAKSVHLDEMTNSDIIFIDMIMPEMDGIHVLQSLSNLEIKAEIILMSGADNEILTKAESFAKRHDLPLIGVLYKPFRESDIRAILTADQHNYR